MKKVTLIFLVAATFFVSSLAAQPATRPTTVPATRPAMPAPDGPSGTDLTSSRHPVSKALDAAADSLVVIKYVWESEVERRELEGLGVVVDADGLVMAPLDLVPLQLPDVQLKEFQIRIPDADGGDPRELDARLEGRDERGLVAFVRGTSSEAPQGGWRPVTFTTTQPAVGDMVYCVGRLPEGAGYTAFAHANLVSAHLRGPVPTVAVGGAGLGPAGSLVLDSRGRAVGIVDRVGQRNAFLTGLDPMAVLESSPRVFVPARSFMASLGDPPTDGTDPVIPWLGAERLTGLTKELREFYGLGDTPGVQVGDVVPGSPAGTAGVRAGEVIVAVDGQPIDRGDTPEELPQILTRLVSRQPVNGTLTLTLLSPTRQERTVQVELAARPAPVRTADRWYAEDLGFSVRELVFLDRYLRRIPLDTPGVAVAFIRDQGNAATAGVRNGDLVRRVNQTPVADLAGFREAYTAARDADPRSPVVLEVRRGPETQILRIEAPQ